ncbi:MAG: hypothetical protein ACYC91_18580 [Solirubrobacteraceae bacterium]
MEVALRARWAAYTFLGEPNAGSTSNNTGFAPGGGDSDLAVAPVRNPGGQYNLYVASLSLANVDVSTSTDGGQTFTVNPVSATIPIDDREWIAADGTSKMCISYHDIVSSNVDVTAPTTPGRPSPSSARHSTLPTRRSWLTTTKSAT